MSTKSEIENLEQSSSDSSSTYSSRPNIDDLIKRVVEEKRKERRNSFIMLGFVFVVVVALALFFSYQ